MRSGTKKAQILAQSTLPVPILQSSQHGPSSCPVLEKEERIKEDDGLQLALEESQKAVAAFEKTGKSLEDQNEGLVESLLSSQQILQETQDEFQKFEARLLQSEQRKNAAHKRILGGTEQFLEQMEVIQNLMEKTLGLKKPLDETDGSQESGKEDSNKKEEANKCDPDAIGADELADYPEKMANTALTDEEDSRKSHSDDKDISP